MKTVNLKNTVSSKIESTNFSDMINDMPKVKSIEMSEDQKLKYNSTRDFIEKEAKREKLQQTYVKLKQNLEACREAKPTSFITVADQKSIDYFETINNQLNNTLLSLQQDKDIALQNFQHKIEALKRMLEELEQKMKVKEKKFNDKILIQNNRIQANLESLQRAKERTKQLRKTKEEIKLEKQLQQLAVDFKKTNPEKDLEYHFPGFKALLGISTAQQPEPVKEEKPTRFKIKDGMLVEIQEGEEVEEEEEEEETPEPPKPVSQPFKDPYEDWGKLTPWQRYLKKNPRKSLYAQYHEALDMGITPDIPEPPNPNANHTNKTISRESLSKILPSYG